MRKQFNKSSLAIAIACSTACLSQTAMAQFDLEEVVVTANKREQVLQDIPTGITAMTGDMLVDRGITDARDLSKIVPSMITGTGNRGEPTINIRGVGFNEVGSPGVALHVDGVYQPRPAMGLIGQYDIQRVEILRGPQSTLYGRNANGGVVNYISQTPDEELGGTVSLGIAEYDQTKISGTINVPLSDTWGARLTLAGMERNEGFYENVDPNGPDSGTIDHSYGGRLVVAGDVNDDINIKVTAAFSDQETSPSSGVSLTPSYSGGLNPSLGSAIPASGDFKISQNDPNSHESSYEGLTAIVNWNLNDEWTLASITGYQAYEMNRFGDFDFVAAEVVRNAASEESTTLTQEFNLSGSIGIADNVFGLFYMDDQAEYASNFFFPVGFGPAPASDEPALPTLTPYYDTTSWALFADTTIHVSDSVRLIAGIRYSEDEQNVGQNVDAPGPPTACTFTVSPIDVETSSTIGRLGAQFDVSANGNLYATISEGVKTGGVNFRSGCKDTFEDEEITSFEVGYKTRSEDGRLTTNISSFFYDYTNLQTNQIVGFSSAINNAPGAEVLGLEIDAAWIPTENWSINGSISYLDATYSEDFININAALAPPGPPPASSPSVNVNGNRLNYAPEWSSNVSVGYITDPVIAGGTLDLRFDVNYRTEVTLREFDTENDRTDDITLVGLSAKWTSASEDYSLRFFVDNLTEEAYYEYASASNLLGFAFATWNTPRQMGLEFTANF